MVGRGDVEKLLSMQAPDRSVLSLYLWVPADPAARRGLPARAGELLALATEADTSAERKRSQASRAVEADRRAALSLLEQHAGEWLGHTAAIFVSGPLGLREAFPLLCPLPDRAVLGVRPHVRPLLAAQQRCPDYLIAVVDRAHAWVLAVAGERIDAVARSDAPAPRSRGFGGWYGLESHRVQQRVIQLARHHYRDTAILLERAIRSDPQPLVVGGHEQTIPDFLSVLPASVRDHFAGSFVADPHTLTPARARALAGPVIADRIRLREERLVTELLSDVPGRLTALGLNACLAAVNQHAVDLLLVPIGGMVPGYVCARCGALSAAGSGCPHGDTSARPTPDLLEDMTVMTLNDGGRVEAVPSPPAEIAARLRFPVIPGEYPPAAPTADVND